MTPGPRFKSVLVGCFLFVLASVCSNTVIAQDGNEPDGILDGTWVAQGPGPALFGQVENILDGQIIGAIHTVVTHPTDADVMYVGAANGGVWRSDNATSPNPNWVPLTDAEVSLSIGALELDPTDVNQLTLLAGVGKYSSFGNLGGARTGLLLTQDGGANWAALDGGGALSGLNISGVAPRANTIVLASNFADDFTCGNVGVWRSTNGGTTFNKLSVAQGVPDGVAHDLASDRSDAATLYAGIVFGSVCTGGALPNGIYKSTTTGGSWSKVSTAAVDTFLDDSVTSNVEISADGDNVFINIIHLGRPAAVFHSSNGGTSWTAMDLPRTPEGAVNALTNPSAVIPGTPITIDSTGTGPHQLRPGAEVEVRNVGGTTGANGIWTVTPTSDFTFQLNGSSDPTAWTPNTGSWNKVVGMNPRQTAGSQGAIHASIVIDPDTSTTVYLGGDRQDTPFPNFIGAQDFSGRLFRGDTTIAPTGAVPSPQWEHLTHSTGIAAIPGGGTANSSSPHADSREMMFDANGNLIQVDDGGIYRRTNPADNTGDWFSINGDLQVTEQHDIDYDTVSNIIISGNQDTGTTQQSASGSLLWHTVQTADGGDVGVDDLSVAGFSTRYSSFQNLGAFQRRVYDAANMLQSTMFPSLTVTPPDLLPMYAFITPLELSAQTPTRLVLAACNAVYESFDQGDTLNQVPGLVGSDCSGGSILGFLQNAMAYGGESGGVPNEDVLWLGSGMALYLRSSPDPSPLTLVGTYPGSAQISDIALDPGDWETAFVVDSTQVYMTSDGGVSWTNITGDLSDSQLRSAVVVPGTPNVLVVGGLSGVSQFDLSQVRGPLTWSQLGTGLPNAPVWDMTYDPADDVLVVGTLGRGAWILDLSPPAGPEFDSTPGPNSTIPFGDQVINTPSSVMSVNVSNLGEQNLTIACALVGANPGDFNIVACPPIIAPASNDDVDVNCQPTAAGPRSATLQLNTNDDDEPVVNYNLTCNGIDPGQIHEDGFEDQA